MQIKLSYIRLKSHFELHRFCVLKALAYKLDQMNHCLLESSEVWFVYYYHLPSSNHDNLRDNEQEGITVVSLLDHDHDSQRDISVTAQPRARAGPAGLQRRHTQ